MADLWPLDRNSMKGNTLSLFLIWGEHDTAAGAGDRAHDWQLAVNLRIFFVPRGLYSMRMFRHGFGGRRMESVGMCRN